MHEADIPIDIHCSRLVDWLVSRDHCDREWQHHIVSVRQRISEALNDMPEHETLVKLLSDTAINYFHCVKIVEILKETEADSKNFLGFYSSKRMRDWRAIVSDYERRNLYLAEAATIVQRLVLYEVPAVRKQIAKVVSDIEDCNVKVVDHNRQMTEAQRMYERELQKLQIAGNNIRKELIERSLCTVDKQLGEIARECRESFPQAINHYRHFNAYIQQTDHHDDSLLAMLQYVVDNGNVTFFEWTYGKRPNSVDKSYLTNVFNAKESVEEETDFNDEIDFGDEEEIVENVQGKDSDNNCACGREALSILVHPDTYRRFCDDLLELRTFLEQRMRHLTTDHVSELLLVRERAQDERLSQLHENGITKLKAWLDALDNVQKRLSEPTLRHLCRIQSETSYLDKLLQQLQMKQRTREKYEKAIEETENKKMELQQQLQALRVTLKALTMNAKTLKEQVEKDISKRYNNRPVNIMGLITSDLK